MRDARAIGPVGTAGRLLIGSIALAVLLFSIDATRPATAIFVGASLLLAAYRGYAGCEVTAISNWILRRDDQIGCVVLAPLDAVDAGSSDPDGGRAHGRVGR